MKRLQSIVCATLLTVAVSSSAIAGNIHSAPAPVPGNIHSITAILGNIHSITGIVASILSVAR